MEQTHYVGSCPHDIPAEWYDSNESTYNVLDTATGAYVVVTTCEACKEENNTAGLIVDDSDMPLDDFYVPDAFVPKTVVVINDNGEAETITLDNED